MPHVPRHQIIYSVQGRDGDMNGIGASLGRKRMRIDGTRPNAMASSPTRITRTDSSAARRARAASGSPTLDSSITREDTTSSNRFARLPPPLPRGDLVSKGHHGRATATRSDS